MMRVTTGGVLRSYRNNLMKSYISQSNAMNTIISQRTFNSYAEDPSSAAKAFRLRKSRMTVQSQYNTCSSTLKKYETGVSSLQSIDNVLDTKDGVPGEYMRTLKGTTLSMLNDPEGDAREQLNKVLDQMSEMLVQDMNQKYGENFIFAGADGHNVPFEVKDNKLYYRGVPVDAAELNVLRDANGDALRVNAVGEIDPAGDGYVSVDALQPVPERIETATPGTYVMLNANGEVDSAGTDYLLGSSKTITPQDYAAMKDPVSGTGPELLMNAATGQPYETDDGSYILARDVSSMPAADYTALENSVMRDTNGDLVTIQKDGKDYFISKDSEYSITKKDFDTAKLNVDKLNYLANEKMFVDIGLGFQENEDGKLIESSAFNAALNGINFLGYGLDADGDPKNLYSLVQKMKEVSESVPEAGNWDDSTWNEFDRLVGKFEIACSNFKTEFTNMDASSTKLKSNADLLNDNYYNLQDQYAELEDIEPVEAINNLLWAQYSYNAALKVGNSILSQSLMDYLN